MSAVEAARRFGVTRQWVSELVRRYRTDGEDGIEPRSRRPRSAPTAVPATTKTRVVQLRDELAHAGLDAGAESIAARLERAGITPPATSTIWRILRDQGMAIPQPQKRPRSSIIRFEAAQPNETWQSDFTHLRLADGTDVEVISWLDDHSRYLLHATAHPRITGKIVTATFTATADEHGLPASTQTDNGMVYTTRFARGGAGPNGFEHLLARLGITQKNGSPSHPPDERPEHHHHDPAHRRDPRRTHHQPRPRLPTPETTKPPPEGGGFCHRCLDTSVNNVSTHHRVPPAGFEPALPT